MSSWNSQLSFGTLISTYGLDVGSDDVFCESLLKQLTENIEDSTGLDFDDDVAQVVTVVFTDSDGVLRDKLGVPTKYQIGGWTNITQVKYANVSNFLGTRVWKDITTGIQLDRMKKKTNIINEINLFRCPCSCNVCGCVEYQVTGNKGFALPATITNLYIMAIKTYIGELKRLEEGDLPGQQVRTKQNISSQIEYQNTKQYASTLILGNMMADPGYVNIINTYNTKKYYMR
jgi:hypothetical protein